MSCNYPWMASRNWFVLEGVAGVVRVEGVEGVEVIQRYVTTCHTGSLPLGVNQGFVTFGHSWLTPFGSEPGVCYLWLSL